MTNNAVWWLLVSFAILVVATLATLYEKFGEMEKRLRRLEAGIEPDDDELSIPAAGSGAPKALRRRDQRF